MDIEPGTIVPLVYQNVAYASDPTLYYVRAVIKDSLTGATITTKNLVHQGTGRYTSTFQAPPDTSGEGRHIDVTITLYTDSGYTTKSPDYQERNFNYIVKTARVFGGGLSGSGIDYKYLEKLIRTILSENLKGIEAALNAPEEEVAPLDLSFIEAGHKTLLQAISSVKEAIKPVTPTDLSPISRDIEKAILKLSAKIDDKEVTEKTDLADVLAMGEGLKAILDEHKGIMDSNKTEISTVFETKFSEYLAKIKEMKQNLQTELSDAPLKPKSAVISKYFPQ